MTRTRSRVLLVLALLSVGTLTLSAQSKQPLTVWGATTATATINSAEQYSDTTKGVQLTLNVSASSGTGQTLDVKLQGFDAVSGQWSDVSGAVFQRLTGTGTRTLTVYPAPEGPGMLRSVTGTNPAAGAEISEVVPANTRWRVRSLFASFVTSATVNTRNVSVIFDDGTNTYFQQRATTTQAAGFTFQYVLNDAGTAPGASNSPIMIPMPVGPVLLGGHRLRTSTVLLDAGDDWSAPQYLVEEWIGSYASVPLPRIWRAVATIAGTTPSFTYTLAGNTLP